MRFRIFVFALLALLLVAGGLLLFVLFARLQPPPTGPVLLNTSVVLRQVQTLSELVTIKYVMEKVVVLEDAKWYGESRVLLLAHGIVKAGLDLGQLTTNHLAVSGRKITVTLPAERITDAYLDDTKSEVIERSTGALRAFDKDLEQNARRIAVEDIRRSARNNGILKDARSRAELQLRVLLQNAGYETVEFKTQE